MSMPNDAAIYELRAVQPDGSTTSAGLYATDAEASEQARLLLASGRARRIETWRRQDGRDDFLAIIGETRRPTANGVDDRHRPPQDENNLIV